MGGTVEAQPDKTIRQTALRNKRIPIVYGLTYSFQAVNVDRQAGFNQEMNYVSFLSCDTMLPYCLLRGCHDAPDIPSLRRTRNHGTAAAD